MQKDDAPEIYCATCFVVQVYKGQTRCTNPNCTAKLPKPHVAKQLALQGHQHTFP